MARESSRPYDRERRPDPYDEHDREKEKCKKEEKFDKCENNISFNFTVNATNSADARGGSGGNGGNGGSAQGGSVQQSNAAAANTGEDGSASSSTEQNLREIQVTKNELDPQKKTEDLAPEEVTSEEVDLADGITQTQSNTATAGEATAGAGGGGGAGGAGGSASATQSIEINNVVLICCGSKDGPPPSYSLGMNNKKFDIVADGDGNTFVNGKKMDVEKLDDGTSIFLFRSNFEKKGEEGGV